MIKENPPEGSTVRAYVYGNPYYGPHDVIVGNDPALIAVWRLERFWQTLRPLPSAITELMHRRRITGERMRCNTCPIAVLIAGETGMAASVDGRCYRLIGNERDENYPLPDFVARWMAMFDDGFFPTLNRKVA